MINIATSSRYKMDRNSLKKQIAEYLSQKGISNTMLVNLVFVGRNKMKQLATTYKKESEALPVLSFSYREETADGEQLLGEVVICYPQAVLLAAERNRKVQETIISLIKHGIDNLLR